MLLCHLWRLGAVVSWCTVSFRYTVRRYTVFPVLPALGVHARVLPCEIGVDTPFPDTVTVPGFSPVPWKTVYKDCAYSSLLGRRGPTERHMGAQRSSHPS